VRKADLSRWSARTNARKSGRCASGRRVIQALGDRDDQGRVRIATPFGIVRRDPDSLPPMVSKAAEMLVEDFGEANKRRLAEVDAKLRSKRSADQLAALQELCFYPHEESVPRVVRVLQSSGDEMARSQAAFLCMLVLENLQTEQTQTKDSELTQAGKAHAQSCYEAVEAALMSDGSPTVRSAAAGVLGNVRLDDFRERLDGVLKRQLLEETDWLVKMCLAVSLGTRGDPSAGNVLLPFIQRLKLSECEDNSLVIQGVIGALGQLNIAAALPELERWSKCSDMMIRMQVAESLQGFAPEENVLELAHALLKDENELVQQQARHSIAALDAKSSSNDQPSA